MPRKTRYPTVQVKIRHSDKYCNLISEISDALTRNGFSLKFNEHPTLYFHHAQEYGYPSNVVTIEFGEILIVKFALEMQDAEKALARVTVEANKIAHILRSEGFHVKIKGYTLDAIKD